MMKNFVLHDESINTYGFRMLTSGVDLSEFRRNPVMLYNHDVGQVIGRWENIRVEDGKILATPVFDLSDEQGRRVAEKVENDFIRMASVGLWPPEGLSDDASLKYPGQTGPTITKWQIREASIVVIGANHNAVAFYDKTGNTIDLKDNEQLIRLFDLSNNPNTNNKNKNSMKSVLTMLGLADTAGESEAATALRGVIANNDRLKAENVTLSSRIDALNKQEKEARKNEAVTLVDAAVKDGRIDAKAKETYLKLFDTDFESTKTALEAIPQRQSVTARIQTAGSQAVAGLSDLEKMNWEELDKAEKLTVLRDQYPEVYKEKFHTRFGCDPQV